MEKYYDRYEDLRVDGKIKKFPPISLMTAESDLYITYNANRMRMDTLSYKYYGDPNFGWLIMLANKEYGTMEFEIPNGVQYRIPYPLQSALNRYKTQIKEYS